jgi:hypothetical protein
MWYYESNHQPVGPVDEAAIAELLKSGTINSITLVWKEGLADWKHLGETELNELSRSVAPASPLSQAPGSPIYPPDAGAQSQAYSAPAKYAGGSGDVTPRVKPAALKKLFIWWAVLLAVMVIYTLSTYIIPTTNMVAVSCIAEIVIIAFCVINFIMLYRFWKIDQDGHASTTPGKAVGFLFIPLFQIYWVFRAYTGLANDQNRYIDLHFGSQTGISVRKAHPLISIIALLFSFVGGLVTYIIVFSKAFSGGLGAASLSGMTGQMTVPLIIFSIISFVLSFMMFYDFYKTALSITEAEEKQQQ